MKLITYFGSALLLITVHASAHAACELRLDSSLTEKEQKIAVQKLSKKFNLTEKGAVLTLSVVNECENGAPSDLILTRCLVKAKITTDDGKLYNQKNRYSATAAELKFETLSGRLLRRALSAMESCL